MFVMTSTAIVLTEFLLDAGYIATCMCTLTAFEIKRSCE